MTKAGYEKKGSSEESVNVVKDLPHAEQVAFRHMVDTDVDYLSMRWLCSLAGFFGERVSFTILIDRCHCKLTFDDDEELPPMLPNWAGT